MRYLLLPLTLLIHALLAETYLRVVMISFIWFFFELGIISYFLLIEFYVMAIILLLYFIAGGILFLTDKFYKKSNRIFQIHAFFWILGSSFYIYDMFINGFSDVINPFYYWDNSWLKTIIGYPQYFGMIIGAFIFPIFYYQSDDLRNIY